MRGALSVVMIATVAIGCGNVSENQVDATGLPTCTDGAKNGDETDVDCGGSSCGACGDNLSCSGAIDCKSRMCTNQICQAATCNDGVANADEIDVDCGGH